MNLRISHIQHLNGEKYGQNLFLIFKIKMIIDEYVYFLPPYHKCYDTHTFLILRMYNIKYKNNITYFTRNNIIYSFIYMHMNIWHHHCACLYNSELRYHKFKFMLKSWFHKKKPNKSKKYIKIRILPYIKLTRYYWNIVENGDQLPNPTYNYVINSNIKIALKLFSGEYFV